MVGHRNPAEWYGRRSNEGAAAQAAEKKSQYYTLLYTEITERKRAEKELRANNRLLYALSQSQLRFVSGISLERVFQDLIASLFEAAGSESGLICQLVDGSEAKPHDHNQQFVCHSLYEDEDFGEQRAFIGEILAASQLPHSTPPASMLRQVTDNQGSNKTKSLLGLPFVVGNRVVGGLSLRSRASEFDSNIVAFLQPVLSTCAQLIMAERNENRRKAAEAALTNERALLEERVAEQTAELRAANQELSYAARSKDEFLATMNHELRTPLNSILLLSEALQAEIYGALNEKQHRSLNNIHESGQHLLALISDILDLEKIEAGKLHLEFKPCSIEEIADASIRLVAEMAEKKSISVNLTIDPAAHQIIADERRLKQMLVNLLSNAIKFTHDNGSIGLKVQKDSVASIIHFNIWDTGIGISQEDLPKLFQPFSQLDSSNARQFGGTGLGLVLVRRMARLHGGDVSVESEKGVGSKFTISLPAISLPALSMSALSAPALSNGDTPPRMPVPNETTVLVRDLEIKATPFSKHDTDRNQNHVANGEQINHTRNGKPFIVLAEDNTANAEALSDFLSAHGYEVVLAQNGYEVIAQAKARRPDLILMDIQMPEMDGLEATRQIRADETLAGISIIALTALVLPGDKERCLEVGVDSFVGKPIHMPELEMAIHKQLSL